MEKLKSTKPVLSIEKITAPFRCQLTNPNDGGMVALAINGRRIIFPVHEVTELEPAAYKLIMELRHTGRDFLLEGSYDEFIIK